MNGIGRAPTFHFLERLAEIVQDLTVDNFDLTFRIHDGYETGNAFNRQPKPVFARADALLGALTIFNLHRDSVPLEDISLLISQRQAAVQMPTILPIRAAEPHLILMRLAGANGRAPFAYVSLQIIGVNCGLPTCSGHLLPRHPRVLYESAVHVSLRAVGERTPHYCPSGIDHIPQLLLATEYRFLG